MRLIFLLASCLTVHGAVIADIRSKLSAGDLLSADALADEFCRANRGSSECAAAWSWVARGAQMMGLHEDATRYVAAARQAIESKPKNDAFLQTAIGATIETEARIWAATGKRDKAIAMLNRELAVEREFAVQARVQKTIHALTLVGKRALHWDESWKGKPTLLFLWAHWCSDCKAQVAAIAEVRAKFGDRLNIIAPTKLYGTEPDEEALIEKVWKESYAAIGSLPHPIAPKMMLDYGVSSTPTVVMIDAKGVVTGYYSSRMSAEQIEKRLR